MKKRVKLEKKSVSPSKIICIGRNYVEHIEELKNEIPSSMVIFNKPNSAISDKLHYIDKTCRYEAEICFLIENEYVSAVGFGLDLTKAIIQNELKKKGLPWERAKAFNSSAVFSDFFLLNNIKEDVRKMRLELYINDKLIQEANYDLMIHKPIEIIKEVKSFMTIEDYDILMTGTPKGVGIFNYDDEFVGKIYIGDELIIEKMWIVE